MDDTTITVEALDLPPELAQKIARAAIQQHREIVRQDAAEKARWLAVLETDDGLKELGKRYTAPLVRASVYGNKIPQKLEINEFLYQACWNFKFLQSDQRRPVLMRGSRAGRQGSQKTYIWCARAICQRYLRKSRFTALDRETADEMYRVLDWESGRKYYLHHHDVFGHYDFRIILPSPSVLGPYQTWINGRFVTGLTLHQIDYIRRLYQIVQKTIKAEKTIKGENHVQS